LLACIWGVFILSLFVVAVTNTTDFEGKEEKIYEQMNKEKAVQKNLSKDASTLIGSFVLLSFLRRKAMQRKRQTRLIMTILAVSGRFKSIKTGHLQQGRGNGRSPREDDPQTRRNLQDC